MSLDHDLQPRAGRLVSDPLTRRWREYAEYGERYAAKHRCELSAEQLAYLEGSRTAWIRAAIERETELGREYHKETA